MLIRPPHMIHAEKGQDGLIIEYSDDDIARIIICEDKATKHARKQIREKVFPDLAHYESGSRDNELIAGVISILGNHHVEDADAIVEKILWDEQRAYRIAVTVGANDASPSARPRRFERYFRGYADAVRGDVSRRRVELMPLADLRTWMDRLARKALAAIDQRHV